jgi:hypothetical protein
MAEQQENGQAYTIQIKGKTLVFRTAAFRAEKGSMLHSGIYNRELTSSLASGSVLVVLVLGLLFGGVKLILWHYIALSALFFGLFILFRLYVFYEEYLEVVIDKAQQTVSIFRRSLLKKRYDFALSDITAIKSGYKLLVPENPDGIQVIEKIALQHGTVIPGFGEVKEFHTVHFEIKGDETVMVFAARDKMEASYVIETFKKYIGGQIAQTD